MIWKVYKVVFRMGSPLHSGWMKIGNIQRTRLYVTGRMLWGAISARITRIIGNNDYVDISDKVKNHLRTTYFYPCFDTSGDKPLLPFYELNGFVYKVDCLSIPANVVDRALLTSYASTAIDPSRLSAEEGSLHEIELFSNKTVCSIKENGFSVNSGSNVYLVGYVFECSKAPSEVKNNWLDALKEIQIGGERTYGFGHLFLESISGESSNVFGYKVISGNNEPEIELDSGNPILAHAITNDNLHGVVEPFVGRETDKKTGRFGEKHSVETCWVPGSIFNKDKIFKITDFGLWVPHNSTSGEI